MLTFIGPYLFQFHFGAKQPFWLALPRTWRTWVDMPGCTSAEVRNIFRMEFQVFKPLEWCCF